MKQRCETCYFWNYAGTGNIGDCKKAQQALAPIYAYCREDEEHKAVIETVDSFYCKEWKEK